MEAHPPHVHHEGHKKTGWNYFYEFLMLFLAVFCGSLGEYQLEHVIEGQRERTFIQTLVRDLEQDTFDAIILACFTDGLSQLYQPGAFRPGTRNQSCDWILKFQFGDRSVEPQPKLTRSAAAAVVSPRFRRMS